MNPRVLLLNSTYEPLRLVSWQRAVTLVFDSKADVVEEYGDFPLRSVKFTMACPAVLRLKTYVSSNKNKVKFSRSNVFLRDNFTCSYCGVTSDTARMTYDHVLPRSRGGKTIWENITTACNSCNTRKADRTPEEAKMHLSKQPYRPSWPVRLRLTLRSTGIHPLWEPFISGIRQ